MANKARKYVSAESLDVSTSALATDTTKVTATFTPDASSTYLYIWSCDVAGSGITLDSIVSLKNNAGTVLSTTNHENKDLTADWATLSGIAFETFGASPTSQSVTLTWRAETTSLTSSIRNARVVAIKLNSTDAYVENTADVTNATTTLAAATTLTFTPPSTGNYLILGSCETKTPALTASVISQITYNSIAYSAATNTPNDITNYMSGLLQASVGSLTATSKTVTLDFARVAGTGTVNCRRARLVALRLDEFTDSSITVDNTLSSTTSTSYVEQSTTGTFNTSTGLDYLVIGTASIAGSSIVLSVGHGLRVGLSTYISESFQESTLAGTVASAHFGAFDVFTATNAQSVSFDHYAETASTTCTTDDVTLSVLLLESTELYWVGGTGTWDGSTATKWAATSGGTGGAAVPKIGTNVFFDSASDSAAPFTVTVSTGAVCNNLTASGLDQTMTLSGSTAMSIYGNLSVPATNFTQSYTGTITFAGTGSETITTNGKTFTAFTFDGVGGTFTLQDALTLSGAATLTRGGLSLSSYTFTCSTFSSNNSNSRTINFGTGKFVITSSSTETVWNTATITSLIIFAGDGTGDALVELTGGGATTKTISAGALPETVIIFPNIYPSSISFSLLNTAGTVAFTASNTVRNLTIANNSFTLSNIAITIYGNLSIGGTSPTLTAGANAWTFAATSGTKTITTNGETLAFPLTFNGAGGTWALQDALTVGDGITSRTVTLTAGTLELNSYTFTIFGVFSSSNSNTRRIQMSGSGGKIVLVVVSATSLWGSATVTNMTTDGNVLVQVTGGGVTSNSINPGQLSEANAISFQLSRTSGTMSFNTSDTVKNLTIDNNSFTVSNIQITIYGNLIVGGTTVTLTGGANAWTFAATSGTKTITTNGQIIDFPLTFSGVGGTWQLQDNLAVGIATSRTVTLTNGTLDLNEFNLTLYGVFSSSNSNARTVDFGAVSKIILTISGTTPFTTATATNFSVLGTNPLIQVTAAGSTCTLTFGAHTEANSLNVQLSCPTTTAVALTGSIRNLTIDDFDITLNNGVRTLYGNFTISGTTPTLQAGTSTTTFAATSGTKTITTSGDTLDFPIIFNGVGGTWQLQDALSVGTATSRTVTLTNGTLDLNNYTFTIYGVFNTNNSNVRTLAFGNTGKIVLSLAGIATTNMWNGSTHTNLTVTGNSLVEVIGSGTLARTFSVGSSNVSGENGAISFSFLNSAGSIALSNGGEFKNLIINASGTTTIFLGTQTIYGNYTWTAGGTIATNGSPIFTFAATSGTKTITTGGVQHFDTTINGVGGTFELADDLNMLTTQIFNLINGTFDAKSFNVTAASMQSNYTNTRTLNMGSGTWTLSDGGGTRGSSQPWNINDGGTGLTLNKGTANIVLSYNGTGVAEFYGGDKTYNNVTFTGTSSGSCRIFGSNTFGTVSIPNNRGKNLFLEAGSTNTFASFDVTGESGDTMQLESTTAGVQATIAYSGTTKQTINYALIQDIVGYPAQTWYAGTNSTNNGNNKDIYFYDAEPYFKAGNGPTTWLQFL